MHVWTLAARDGAVQRKKGDRLDAPLQGPVLCKRGHAYAYARDSYGLCRIPLSGAHLSQLGSAMHSCAWAVPWSATDLLKLLLRPEVCARSSTEHAGPGRLSFRWPPCWCMVLLRHHQAQLWPMPKILEGAVLSPAG